MLCMRQLQSCYTSLLSPCPLLIPQGHLTLDVLVPRHLTALLYPGSPADPCKTALRTKWGPEGEFAGSHGPTLPPILSAEKFCHRQKGAGGVPMGRPFRRTFKYVLEQKGKIFWTLSTLEHNLVGYCLRLSASNFITRAFKVNACSRRSSFVECRSCHWSTSTSGFQQLQRGSLNMLENMFFKVLKFMLLTWEPI